MSSAAKGALWMVGYRMSDRVVGLASTVVLARLLLPGDFGLVAMAMSVVALIELLRAFGFDSALIQRKDVTRAHYDSAFSLNIALGAICGLVLAAIALPAGAFFREPRLVSIILCLAVVTVIQGAENPGTAEFRRNLEFRTEFVFLLGKRALSFVAVITAALMLRSYWALVIGIMSGRLAEIALGYILHPFRPRWNLSAARDLLSFSGWLLATNLSHFVNQRASHFVIGRMLGPHALGTFTLGSEIASIPSTELLAPVNRAMLPVYAKAENNRTILKSNFLRVLGVTTLIAVPAAVGLSAVAEPLVLLMLSDKWRDAIPVIRIMGISSAVGALTACIYPIYLASGRPRIPFALAALRVPIAVPAMAIGAQQFGLVGVAVADLLATLALVPVSLTLVMRILDVRATEIVARSWRPFVASAVMFGVVHTVLSGPDSVAEWGRLAAGASVGIITYVAAVGLMWLPLRAKDSAEVDLVGLSVSLVRPRNGAGASPTAGVPSKD